jgi:hypothetical protein
MKKINITLAGLILITALLGLLYVFIMMGLYFPHNHNTKKHVPHRTDESIAYRDCMGIHIAASNR